MTNLKSWIPLSILNTDYKIIAKVLSNRLKTGLMEIINPDQIGYMQNRYCGENVNLIADVFDYCRCKNVSFIILLADFEKAFDTVKWSVLKQIIIKQIQFWKQFSKVDFSHVKPNRKLCH